MLRRIENIRIKEKRPGPSDYRVNYTCIEPNRTITIGKTKRMRFTPEHNVSPVNYIIKSKFDLLIEYYQRQRSFRVRKQRVLKNRKI